MALEVLDLTIRIRDPHELAARIHPQQQSPAIGVQKRGHRLADGFRIDLFPDLDVPVRIPGDQV